MIYVRVKNGKIFERKDWGGEAPPKLAAAKAPWIPYAIEADPEHDPGTHRIATREEIGADRVTLRKTLYEIPAAEQIAAIEARYRISERATREAWLVILRVTRALWNVPGVAEAIRAEFGLAPGAALPDLAGLPIFERAARAETEIKTLRGT